MSFWEQHAKREAEHRLAPNGAQNAPQECAQCGHVGQDVYFGTCYGCFKRWEDAFHGA